jgi:hypothetical protein
MPASKGRLRARLRAGWDRGLRTTMGKAATRGEDYAFAQPSLTTKKLRRLELAAGAPRRQGPRWLRRGSVRAANQDRGG